MKKKLVAGVLVSSVVAAGSVGLLSTSASAAALPQQRSAAHQSLATATVINDGVHPQFFTAILQSVAAATVVKASEYAVKATAKVTAAAGDASSSSSSSDSSSSSSGGPATAPQSPHGVIPGDAQFNATN